MKIPHAAVLIGALMSTGSAPSRSGPEDRTWIEIDGAVYGAKPDKRGPIGGGAGYVDVVAKGDYTVRDADELLDALSRAKRGQTVFIPEETEIDLTARIYVEELVLEVPEGVTLAGERGRKGSLGAILTSDALKTPVMIRAKGPDVRVTGLRLRGPNPKRYADHHRRAFKQGKGRDYFYKFPTSYGVTTEHPRLEVDNCEISAFSHGGVYLLKGDGHRVHHSFIHHCQYSGLGYGVVHDAATSTIEFNLFDANRHSIAGTGVPGCGYVARHNVELGISSSHCFDMHGGRDREDGTDVAGTAIEISNNTFRSSKTAVRIRGVPEVKCEVNRNWFLAHDAAKGAVSAHAKTTTEKNAYGAKPATVR